MRNKKKKFFNLCQNVNLIAASYYRFSFLIRYQFPFFLFIFSLNSILRFQPVQSSIHFLFSLCFVIFFSHLYYQDMCRIIIGDQPTKLPQECNLQKPFLMELLEDILTNFHPFFFEVFSPFFVLFIIQCQVLFSLYFGKMIIFI